MWLDETAQLVEKRLKPATRGLNAAGAFTGLLMVILVTAHVISRAFFSANRLWAPWNWKS